MDQQALALLFYREIEKIAAQEDLSLAVRIKALYQLLQLLLLEVTRRERIQFTTLFARLAYVGHKYGFERPLQFFIHRFRKLAAELDQAAPDTVEQQQLFQLGMKSITSAVEAIFGEPPSPALAASLPRQWPLPLRPPDIKAFRPLVRVVALEDDPGARQLLVRDEEDPSRPVLVQYNIPERNENFQLTIEVIRSVFGFPVTLNLLEVEIDAQGVYRPRGFVVEPDYLIDVTAVAECFQPSGAEPWLYMLKKFMPFETSQPLVIGHIANFFLDELLSNPELSFRELFPKVFTLNPVSFCLFSDREIREIRQGSQRHFLTIKHMAREGFSAEGIDPAHAYLEPSFYSEQYGLQGRLDLFYRGEERSAIVELKSGKPFLPNQYGLSNNHFTQTLLYDLLIRSTFGRQTRPTNYILYSGQPERPLRFAPAVAAQQMEALQVRNQLVAIEWLLCRLGLPGEDLLSQARLLRRLRPANFPKLRGYLERDLTSFAAVFDGLHPTEQKYLTAFTGFIAREHRLAKVGVQGQEGANGMAALWLNARPEKEEQFELMGQLQLRHNDARNEEPLLTFSRTDATNPLANFRQGDIAVLYPEMPAQEGPLGNQIFKCTIVAISSSEVTVRLRSRQFNDQLFARFEYWNLEHDLLDSGFTGLYRSLFAFAGYAPEQRALWLTARPPRRPQVPVVEAPLALTAEQQLIFRRAVAAEEYFLLWGPPGTGKTSMMLRYLVEHFLRKTDENLLLLAYTNRAVDEICEAIEAIGGDIRDHYLRIGSRYATAAPFQQQLLGEKIGSLASRKELRDLIDRHRIIVGTVASVAGRQELLQLKTFDRVIIDEASQVLEPMLAGLLPRFRRCLLIGDHKQLPAVVAQPDEESIVEDADLQELGICNLRNSLFERLYRRCIEAGWTWAYAQLSHQGRMHQDIMTFPNEQFYGGTLKVLPASLPLHQRQLKGLDLPGLSGDDLAATLARNRLVFLATPADDSSPTRKTNRHEAALVERVVVTFQHLYQAAGRSFPAGSLGIITPYRAQIAQIRQTLESAGIDADALTIDTVERYQGGARDVIIISLCTNSLQQLASMVSLSEEGVDRKLNVALTRAREHLVLIGNPDLLKQNPVYAKLLQHCGFIEKD